MIPKSFTLFGHTYTINLVKSIDSVDSCGECIPMNNEIRVKDTLPLSIQEQTYYHEMVHCILTNLSYNKLNLDEKFVDRFSMALHQILKTSKYL